MEDERRHDPGLVLGQEAREAPDGGKVETRARHGIEPVPELGLRRIAAHMAARDVVQLVEATDAGFDRLLEGHRVRAIGGDGHAGGAREGAQVFRCQQGERLYLLIVGEPLDEPLGLRRIGHRHAARHVGAAVRVDAVDRRADGDQARARELAALGDAAHRELERHAYAAHGGDAVREVERAVRRVPVVRVHVGEARHHVAPAGVDDPHAAGIHVPRGAERLDRAAGKHQRVVGELALRVERQRGDVRECERTRLARRKLERQELR